MVKIATSKPSEVHRSRRPLNRWVKILAGVGIVFVLAIVAFVIAMMMRMNYVPADLDTSTRLSTDNDRFVAYYAPEVSSISINQIHSWKLRLETPEGQPVENAQIRVDGDMPQHGHGLPTRPQVTRYLGEGEYLVEGLKFHMPGWWIVEFDITAGGVTDHVTFNLLLQ